MPSVMMGLLDAKLLASALVPHASRDDITPPIKNIVLGGEHGNYAYATDRYTVGRYDLTHIVEDFPEEVLYIPRDLLSAIRSLGPASLVDHHTESNYRLVIETVDIGKMKYTKAKVLWHDEELGDTLHWMRTWNTITDRGFPPIGRLFQDLYEGGAGTALLGPEHVDKFTGYAKRIRERVAVSFTSSERTKNLSPILIEIGTRFKGLLQPNLLVRRDGLGPDLLAENAAAKAEAEAEVTPAEGEATE